MTERKKDGSKALRGLREIAIIVVIALVVSFAIKTFVVRSFYIPSSSMENTLQIDDRIMVNQLPWNEPQRGQIIVFDDPGGWLPPDTSGRYKPNPVLEFLGLVPANAGQQLIKRVIGVGGDTVECCDEKGRLKVNGQPIDETYIKRGTDPSAIKFKVEVPEGSYWVMGDNRANSLDSRYNTESAGGPFVSKDNVVGTVFVINWPLDRFSRVKAATEVFADVPNP